MLKLGNKYEELNEKYDCTGHYKEKLDENFLEFTLEELGISISQELYEQT